MAARTSLAPPNGMQLRAPWNEFIITNRTQGKAERKATGVGSRESIVPHANPSCKDTASSHLSERQKKLLAGFGVLSSGHLQRRLMSISLDNARQDHLPTHPVNKEVTTSPFSPTFIQPQPDIHSQNKESNMTPFDPSKYGAPAKKQRVAVPGRNQTGTVKLTESEVTVPGLTSTPVPDQTPSSVAPSTVSEVSNHAMSSLTQATEISNTTKTVEVKALKPKSSNKLSIPGFDPSKYGMPSSRLNRSLAQDEQTLKTDTEASSTSFQTSPPAANIAATSLPQKQDSTSIDSAPHLTQKALEHTSKSTRLCIILRSSCANLVQGSFSLPKNAVNEDNNFSDRQSPVVSNTETASTVPAPQNFPIASHGPSHKMVTSSLRPFGKGMSKEERLEHVQQVALREIGSRNRHKGDAPETTSMRDLRIARDAASFESPLATTAAVTSTMKQFPVNVASNHGTSQNARPQRDSGVPNAYSTIPPVLPGTSKEDRLKQAQQASLRSIGMRNRGDGRYPESTSLVDLNLARTPVQYEDHVSAAALSPVAHMHTAGSTSPQKMLASAATSQLNTGEIRSGETASAASKFAHRTTRNPKWCNNEELRPEPNMETTGNAWGSEIPSHASVASSESLRPMQLHGRLFNGPAAAENDEIMALVGWDGKMQPPPVDWNDRPRFNNNSPAFKNGFNNWFAAAASECYEIVDRTPMFKTIPSHLVSNVEWHADGLAMTRREFTLNAHNLSRYGYDSDPADVAKYAEEITAQEYEDWAKLDMREADNVKFKDETTEQLVNNWLIHYEKSKKTISLAVMPGHKPTRETRAPKPDVNTNEPSLNIYLRPAVRGDMGQLADLYNWWVENSARPAEIRPIDTNDMRLRFDTTKDDRLPFIVAILKGKKDVQRNYYTGVKTEQVVGFACATGFTAADYVEHIAAELEIYVHHKYLRQGIGRCLIDKLMCATDRGHMERGGYPFHCDPAERHWYEVGGARDLHKLMFVARQYSRAKKDRPEEVEVTTWMKKWLVKEWDFEHEACLKQAGAKNGRFLDLTYFTKFGKWLPEDGRVPDPEPKDHKRH
jgi:L-amino acid N-acyltransferase YncA